MGPARPTRHFVGRPVSRRRARELSALVRMAEHLGDQLYFELL